MEILPYLPRVSVALINIHSFPTLFIHTHGGGHGGSRQSQSRATEKSVTSQLTWVAPVIKIYVLSARG